jgi:hypothetical protein
VKGSRAGAARSGGWRARSGASSILPTYPPVDECRDRLHRPGWSLGESCFGQTWQVDGSKGQNRLLATGASQAEAWYRAADLARDAEALRDHARTERLEKGAAVWLAMPDLAARRPDGLLSCRLPLGTGIMRGFSLFPRGSSRDADQHSPR